MISIAQCSCIAKVLSNNAHDAASDKAPPMKIYLVGGAVRDRLLGRPIRERDWVVVGAVPQEMERDGFHTKDPDFPVYLHPETGEEYALARRESKSGAGHKGFTFDFSPTVTLEEDLARRDLTINAIAQSHGGRIIDPYQGQADLHSRSLRHVTPAFVEDPLRVLRLARFQAELGEFHFTIFAQTESLAADICASGELRTLSPGRIWRETARALAAPDPATFFANLESWGELVQLMPWLTSGAAYDFQLALFSLTRASKLSPDPDIRLAAFLSSIALDRGTRIEIPRNWPVSATVRTLTQLCAAHPLPDDPLDAQTTMSWLESVDAWRRSERFTALLKVWVAAQADSSARLDRLQRCCDISRKVPRPGTSDNPREMVRAYRLQQIARSLCQ